MLLSSDVVIKSPTHIGFIGADNDYPQRRLYFLELDRVDEWPETIDLGSPRFGLFLALDSTGVADEDIERLASRALKQGVVFVCTWGRYSLDDKVLFDHVIVRQFPEEDEKTVIMTTSHLFDPLDDALGYFLFTPVIAEAHVASCRAWLACVVGSPELAQHVRGRMSNPQSLHDDCAAHGHDDPVNQGDDEEDDEPYVIEFWPAKGA